MKDVQNQSDSRGVEIQKVGIKNFELPILIQRKDAEDKVIYASATCGVTLPAHYKGTHMSRFVEVLNEWRGKKTLDIKSCVESMVEKLDAKSAYLKFDFKFLRQLILRNKAKRSVTCRSVERYKITTVGGVLFISVVSVS